MAPLIWSRPEGDEALLDPEPPDGIPELERAELLTVVSGDGRELPASRRQLSGDAPDQGGGIASAGLALGLRWT